jgi:hypothetical protein
MTTFPGFGTSLYRVGLLALTLTLSNRDFADSGLNFYSGPSGKSIHPADLLSSPDSGQHPHSHPLLLQILASSALVLIYQRCIKRSTAFSDKS